MAQSRENLNLSFVLLDDNELLALAELKFHDNPDFPDYSHWLGGVFVVSDKRSQGYSNMILPHLFEHAKNMSISALYLQCKQHNIDLYLKHDFEAIYRMNVNGVDNLAQLDGGFFYILESIKN